MNAAERTNMWETRPTPVTAPLPPAPGPDRALPARSRQQHSMCATLGTIEVLDDCSLRHRRHEAAASHVSSAVIRSIRLRPIHESTPLLDGPAAPPRLVAIVVHLLLQHRRHRRDIRRSPAAASPPPRLPARIRRPSRSARATRCSSRRLAAPKSRASLSLSASLRAFAARAFTACSMVCSFGRFCLNVGFRCERQSLSLERLIVLSAPSTSCQVRRHLHVEPTEAGPAGTSSTKHRSVTDPSARSPSW